MPNSIDRLSRPRKRVAVGAYTEADRVVAFWQKISLPDDTAQCWLWRGCRRADRYGQFWVGDRFVYAHRFAYELLRAPIPPRLTIDHLCKNRSCVNPWHMEPVTMQENLRRGEGPAVVNSRKTRCPHGHEYTVANTYVVLRRGRWPTRVCKACLLRPDRREQRRLATRRYRQRLCQEGSLA
jgi:hypothetical protein